MNTLKFTSSIESVYTSGYYTWDKLYPITKIVDDEHVKVINNLGMESCICISHFNDGLLKSTKGLSIVFGKVKIATEAVYQATQEPLDGLTGYVLSVDKGQAIVWIDDIMTLPFSEDEIKFIK